MVEVVMNGKALRLVKGDITELDVDAFVFYAKPDLKLGTGFGGAIAQRGGPGIQDELNRLAPVEVGESVVTGGGNLKAKRIIHTVGPRHHEPDEEGKLRGAVRSALRTAEREDLLRVALPAMGVGFYGVSLDLCSRVMVEEVTQHLANAPFPKEVILCVLDNRELKPFEERIKSSELRGSL